MTTLTGKDLKYENNPFLKINFYIFYNLNLLPMNFRKV